MQENRHINIDRAHKVSFLHIVMRGIAAVLFMIAFYSITTAQTYTFTGAEDDRYENPANWTPAFPGTEIEAGTEVFIEGYAIATETLTINGTLHLAVGAALETRENAVIISNSGKLINDGDVFAASLLNSGTVNNNFAAILELDEYVSEAGSTTNNLMAAEILVSGDMINGGIFNNYSTIVVENGFENTAAFNQMRSADLQVNGTTLAVLSLN